MTTSVRIKTKIVNSRGREMTLWSVLMAIWMLGTAATVSADQTAPDAGSLQRETIRTFKVRPAAPKPPVTCSSLVLHQVEKARTGGKVVLKKGFILLPGGQNRRKPRLIVRISGWESRENPAPGFLFFDYGLNILEENYHGHEDR